MPKQACLDGSGVPRDSPDEGHSPWDFALITSGKARSPVFYFRFYFYFILLGTCGPIYALSMLCCRYLVDGVEPFPLPDRAKLVLISSPEDNCHEARL